MANAWQMELSLQSGIEFEKLAASLSSFLVSSSAVQ
jgi:hypothetical protein